MGPRALATFERILKPLGIEIRRRADSSGSEATWPGTEQPASPKARGGGLRTFFAETMGEAMRKAQAALGPDALILRAGSTDAALRSAGAFEVVCLMSDKTESEQDQPLLFDAAVGELATLRKEVNEIVRQLLRGTGAREDGGASQAIRTDKTVVELLVEGGVSSQFAARILGVTEELAKRHRLVRSENPALRSDTSSGWSRVDVTRAIASMLPQPQGTPLPDTIQPRLVLAGAPGSGKTTVALKLAETFRSLTGRRVRVLAYQPDVGQSSNVPACGQVCIVRSLAGLAVACRRLNSDEPLIVDCCGFDSSNLEDAERFSRAIAEMPEFETHLVLPAFMKSIDARKALDLLEMLSPNRIVLNRLDEARTIGGVVEAVVMSGRPVSYLNGGKLGSTVIRRATAGALARRLVQSALRVRFAGQPLAAHPEF